MRIKRTLSALPSYYRLKDFDPGVVVRLKSRLSRNMDHDDPILIVNMQSYTLYVPHGSGRECEPMEGKVVILNMATGRLSCVDRNRECHQINAEVHVS